MEHPLLPMFLTKPSQVDIMKVESIKELHVERNGDVHAVFVLLLSRLIYL